MNYINSKLFLAQCILQFVLIFLVSLFSLSITTQAIVAGVFLCFVGIPHGSNDYLYRKDRTAFGLFKFLSYYLGIIFSYAILWYFLPSIALILFFLISFHHFGQSNYENKNIWDIPSILWGFCLIMLPVIIHFEEALSIFKSMLVFEPSYAANQIYIVQFNTWKIIVVSILSLTYLLSIFTLKTETRWKFVLQFLLVLIWYLITPLLFGFIIVFCLWHSLQSVRHQNNYFVDKYHRSENYFYLSMLPFSIIALLVFGYYLYAFDFNIGGAFIILSLITLPHVLIMHQQYEIEN
jgi:Brp/Blh family beta-carotene 15,15'-monooxygenase